jgi:hypothetical protein
MQSSRDERTPLGRAHCNKSKFRAVRAFYLFTLCPSKIFPAAVPNLFRISDLYR